jgi:hypothetical protein
MSDELNSKTSGELSKIYMVRLEGHLGPEWSDWFGGLTIQLDENGETLLTGPGLDQSALHGLLKKVRDLGLTLLSVCPASEVEKE